MKINKRDKVILIWIITFIVAVIVWVQISMNWSNVTCAKITHLKRSRGWKVYISFERNGEIVEDRVDRSYFRYKNLKDLQKKGCCEIRYSIYWPYNIEIIEIY